MEHGATVDAWFVQCVRRLIEHGDAAALRSVPIHGTRTARARRTSTGAHGAGKTRAAAHNHSQVGAAHVHNHAAGPRRGTALGAQQFSQRSWRRLTTIGNGPALVGYCWRECPGDGGCKAAADAVRADVCPCGAAQGAVSFATRMLGPAQSIHAPASIRFATCVALPHRTHVHTCPAHARARHQRH